MGEISIPAPSPFARERDLLTVREFELFRESQARLETERQLRMNEAALAMERLMEVKVLNVKAETEARFVSSDKALSLESLGTKQHLAALNGEQARLLADRERFVSKDRHEAEQKDLQMWRDQVNAFMNVGQGRDRGIGLSWGVIMGAVGILTGLIGVGLAILGHVK